MRAVEGCTQTAFAGIVQLGSHLRETSKSNENPVSHRNSNKNETFQQQGEKCRLWL
jgi:hypothetical protein